MTENNNKEDTQKLENSEHNPSPWGNWNTVNSAHQIKYRTRKEDDLGNGNFAWAVQIIHSDFGILGFDYKIEIRKGNGTFDTIEGQFEASAGVLSNNRLSAEIILKVTASNITRQ